VVLFDTNAQPMILGVQFAKKMGMFDSKLQKFIWQICSVSGSVKKIIGKNLDFITLNFNEGTDQKFCLQVKCLVTNYDVLIRQEALLPPGFTIDNWFKHAYYRMDWETNGHHLRYIPLIYMGTIVLWFTIVCSRKHTLFPTSNKLAMNG